jgi:gamma-glutamyltranspeptidase/glutathione hydrolase
MGPVIAFQDGQPAFTVGAAGGSTIITTSLQIIVNHVDFGMPLPDALAAPRVSQRNTPTSLATGPILPLDNYPGDATGIQFLGHGVAEAVAEPLRLYGGSALVVHPAH